MASRPGTGCSEASGPAVLPVEHGRLRGRSVWPSIARRQRRQAGTYHAHHCKLYGKDEQIRPLLASGVSIAATARFFGVNRETMRRYIEDKGLRSII
jgi:hypothetical protein